MSKPLYLCANPRQTADITKLLSRKLLGPEHVAAAKKAFLFFWRTNGYLHLDARLAIGKALSTSPASNKFWTEVMCGVLDCSKERSRFRRQILWTAGRLDGSKTRETISRALASPKPAKNTLRPVVKIGSPAKTYRHPRHFRTQGEVWATFGVRG